MLKSNVQSANNREKESIVGGLTAILAALGGNLFLIVEVSAGVINKALPLY